MKINDGCVRKKQERGKKWLLKMYIRKTKFIEEIEVCGWKDELTNEVNREERRKMNRRTGRAGRRTGRAGTSGLIDGANH